MDTWRAFAGTQTDIWWETSHDVIYWLVDGIADRSVTHSPLEALSCTSLIYFLLHFNWYKGVPFIETTWRSAQCLIGPAQQVPSTAHNTIPDVSRNTSSIHPTSDTLFYLNNVLAPHLVCNLFSVRKFTCNSCCSIEFDAFAFYVKDPRERASSWVG
jgi:hypothetical protein